MFRPSEALFFLAPKNFIRLKKAKFRLLQGLHQANSQNDKEEVIYRHRINHIILTTSYIINMKYTVSTNRYSTTVYAV